MMFIEKFGKQLENEVSGRTPEGQQAAAGPDQAAFQDPLVDQALRDFRLSVHAWSDSAYNRPRTLPEYGSRRSTWRRAAAWALGCVLAAGVAGGGMFERHHRQEAARIAAAREAEHQRQLAEERAREAEELLARVDNDVSREVPTAMEPLAQLMAEDESQ